MHPCHATNYPLTLIGHVSYICTFFSCSIEKKIIKMASIKPPNALKTTSYFIPFDHITNISYIWGKNIFNTMFFFFFFPVKRKGKWSSISLISMGHFDPCLLMSTIVAFGDIYLIKLNLLLSINISNMGDMQIWLPVFFPSESCPYKPAWKRNQIKPRQRSRAHDGVGKPA